MSVHARKEAPRAGAPQRGRTDLKPILVTFACSSAACVGSYYLATYVNNHLTEVLGMERTTGLALRGIGASGMAVAPAWYLLPAGLPRIRR